MGHKHTDKEDKRAFTDGSSGATADLAVEGNPHPEDRDPNGPHAKPAPKIPEGQKHDQMADKQSKTESRQEALLDEAIEETFPGSDPISPKHIT